MLHLYRSRRQRSFFWSWSWSCFILFLFFSPGAGAERETGTCLPQDEKADQAARKKQLETARSEYKWNMEVSRCADPLTDPPTK